MSEIGRCSIPPRSKQKRQGNPELGEGEATSTDHRILGKNKSRQLIQGGASGLRLRSVGMDLLFCAHASVGMSLHIGFVILATKFLAIKACAILKSMSTKASR